MTVSATAAAFLTNNHYVLSTGLSKSFFPARSILPVIVGRGSPTAACTVMKATAVEVIAGAAIQNFSGGASNYFKSFLVPAASLACSSLTSLFSISKMAKNIQETTEREKWFVKAYHVLSLVSFALAITTILFCTAASVAILYGSFNPMAETGYILLNREFEFEYLTARLSFLVSLLTFLISVQFRVLLEFDLLKDERLGVAYSVSLVMFAFVAHFLSYANETIRHSPNIVAMTILLGKVVARRIMKQRMPMQLISLVCASLSAGLLGKRIIVGNGKATTS